MEEKITKKIGQIQFGVISPKYIKKVSKVEVLTSELYDTDGYPVDTGLMDPHMGVIDPGLRCKTCGGGLRSCQGHFGHIKLSKPVLHISYIKIIHELLLSFCKHCGRILLTDAELQHVKESIERAKKEHNPTSLLHHKLNVLKLTKKKKKCFFCNAPVQKITIERPSTFFAEGNRTWPDEIKDSFEKILDEDLIAYGFNPDAIRPEWLVITLLFVPPITVRPSITLESGDRSEDDLTHKLSDIVRVNQRLGENINAGAPEIIIEDLWDLLQYHITTFFDNKTAQVPPARHRTFRELKTLKQRLSGKSGRFRHSLAGKRVNFCGRSVISPDTNVAINEVGIPERVAKEITMPETITEWNKPWLVSLVKNTPNYPCANYIISPDGRRRKVTQETSDALIQELDVGWIIERQLIDGDIVLFNRQPSLHRLSMMCHIAKIVPGRTLRINPGVCIQYNADFDGDEMNLHVPQTIEARAEAKHIALIDYNLITPRYGLSIVGAVMEMLFGLYSLTNDLKLTREDAADLVIEAGLDITLENKKTFDGKEIFNLILPEDLNYESSDLVIKNGKIVKGIISSKYIGIEGGILIHLVNKLYGSQRAVKFLNELQQLALAFIRHHPYSLSFHDLKSKQLEKKISKYIDDSENSAIEIIEQYKKNKIAPLPGLTARETMEAKVIETLNKARNQIGDLIKEENKEDTTLMTMIKSKTGGKILNLVEISGVVGQQALRGKRINEGYTERVLPHFKRGDVGPQAHGFVKTSYKNGLSPLEIYFNCIVGRDSYIDTAMRTPKSGYLQRRLINSLQDLKVNYDGTVRDAGQNIIQFKYGGDAIDVSKSDHGSINV